MDRGRARRGSAAPGSRRRGSGRRRAAGGVGSWRAWCAVLALKSIANSEKVASMLPDRGLSGPHMARLLGAWRSSGPAYASLARAIRLLVLDGRLPLRTRLPGERELAEALGVSRTTATAAYAALRDEGFLASRRGSGSWTRLPADAAVASDVGPYAEDVIDLS